MRWGIVNFTEGIGCCGMKPACDRLQVVVTVADLDSDGRLSCPRPEQHVWNAHPRVYLPMTQATKVSCPYCGTQYQLQAVENQPTAMTATASETAHGMWPVESASDNHAEIEAPHSQLSSTKGDTHASVQVVSKPQHTKKAATKSVVKRPRTRAAGERDAKGQKTPVRRAASGRSQSAPKSTKTMRNNTSSTVKKT